MTNTLYIATKVWDSDPDNVTTELAVAEISNQDWQDFESEQQLLRKSKALKFCFNDFRFDFLDAQELDRA